MDAIAVVLSFAMGVCVGRLFGRVSFLLDPNPTDDDFPSKETPEEAAVDAKRLASEFARIQKTYLAKNK